MTYAELADIINKLPQERKEDTVTVFNSDMDEFTPCFSTGESGRDEVSLFGESDVLDAGHLFLLV